MALRACRFESGFADDDDGVDEIAPSPPSLNEAETLAIAADAIWKGELKRNSATVTDGGCCDPCESAPFRTDGEKDDGSTCLHLRLCPLRLATKVHDPSHGDVKL